MEKKGQIDGQIEEAQKRLVQISEQIGAERTRLEKFGSRDAYYDALRREKQVYNELEILKSKRRSEIMESIVTEEISPRLKQLRDGALNENQRISLCLELALYSEVIHRMRSHFFIFEEIDQVSFQIDDPEMKYIYGQKTESVTGGIKRTKDDLIPIRNEKMVLKNPNEMITITLAYPQALKLEEGGKGKIIESGEPIFIEKIREDRTPETIEALRDLSLGRPIAIGNEVSPEAKALLQKCVTGMLELSPTCFSQFITDAQIKKVLKKFS